MKNDLTRTRVTALLGLVKPVFGPRDFRHAPGLAMALAGLLVGLSLASCHKKDSTAESAFLGKLSSESAGTGEEDMQGPVAGAQAGGQSPNGKGPAAAGAAGPASGPGADGTGDQNKLEAKDKIVVSAAEWESLSVVSRKCRAEYEAYRSEAEIAKKAEYAKGGQDCRDAMKKDQADFSDKIIGEAQKLLDEARDRLARYSLASALVNGECQAMMTNGDRISFVLENVCVNVVNKKVGNDGEISGLIGAVSNEATRQGIVSLDCDIGASHIALLSKRCEKSVGTGAGAGKVEGGGKGSGKKSTKSSLSKKSATPSASPSEGTDQSTDKNKGLDQGQSQAQKSQKVAPAAGK